MGPAAHKLKQGLYQLQVTTASSLLLLALALFSRTNLLTFVIFLFLCAAVFYELDEGVVAIGSGKPEWSLVCHALARVAIGCSYVIE